MTDTTVSPDAPPGTGEKRGGPRRKLLIGLLLGVLFLGGLAAGAVAYFGPARLIEAFNGQAPAAREGEGEAVELSAPGTAETEGSGQSSVFLMEDHIVNLVSAEGPSTRYVRVRLAIVYDPVLTPIGTLQERKPHLRDAFLGFLSQLTERDLEGSYGLTMLREELLRRARAVTGGRGVREVLITDLVIQ